jgi:hypothetical protein
MVFDFFADVPIAPAAAPTPSVQRPAAPCHADWEEVTPRDLERTAKRCLLLHVAMNDVKSPRCCFLSEQSRA